MASYLYTMEDIENTYANINHHISTRDIIRRHSSNTNDIRAMAIDSLELSHVKNVLDLGCGYGFFVEILNNRLHDDAQVTGIDIIDYQNRKKFLFTVNSIGYEGEFVHGSADIINSMGDNTFDLVISSYSLYFFPHLIPHIARILSPGGIFISLTHSRNTLNEIVQ
ncbi:MAG: class I SAM-dependent methyltransferase, partial [Spirochaetota bacterium]